MPKNLKPALVTVGLLLSIGSGGAWAQEIKTKFSADERAALNNRLRVAPEAKLEPVGVGPARAWITKLDLHRVPGTGEWVQLFRYKIDSHTSRTGAHLIALNLHTGKVKDVGMMPGIEVFASAWSGNTFYLTNWYPEQPGHLFAYEPKVQTLRDLGAISEFKGGAWKMAVGPDGTIALAGWMCTPSLYNPATGQMKSYGQISTEHSYIYYIDQDADWIYMALRGRVPWKVVAMNKKTGEQKTLMSAPVEDFIRFHGGRTLTHTSKGGEKKDYIMQGETIAPYNPPAKLAAADAKPEPPQVVLDESPGLSYQPQVIVHYQQPDDHAKWKQATLPIPLGEGTPGLAARLADGRIAVTGEAYWPLAVFDPLHPEQKVVQAPMGEVSAFSMLAVGNTVYVGGYPTGVVLAFDPDKPVTRPEAAPGQEAVPLDSSKANPHLVRYFGKDMDGAHNAEFLTLGSDGRIWLVGRRHRYFKGFGIAWYDPKTDKTAVLDDGGKFDQYQIGCMAPLDGGKRLAVSTWVQPNPQRPGEVGTNGKLFIIDTEKNQIVGAYEPLPGLEMLTGITQVGKNTLIGACYPKDKSDELVYYRFNLETGKIEATAPGASNNFAMAPDGKLWTLAGLWAETYVLSKVNPQDLSIEPVALLHGKPGLLFDGNDVLLTGIGRQLQRVKVH